MEAEFDDSSDNVIWASADSDTTETVLIVLQNLLICEGTQIE